MLQPLLWFGAMSVRAAYDPEALLARADAFRRLARSWEQLADRDPLRSGGRLRRTASAALFAAYMIEETFEGGPVNTDRIGRACERARSALEQARGLDARLQACLEGWHSGAPRCADHLGRELLARQQRLRDLEATVEWLRAT